VIVNGRVQDELLLREETHNESKRNSSYKGRSVESILDVDMFKFPRRCVKLKSLRKFISKFYHHY